MLDVDVAVRLLQAAGILELGALADERVALWTVCLSHALAIGSEGNIAPDLLATCFGGDEGWPQALHLVCRHDASVRCQTLVARAIS